VFGVTSNLTQLTQLLLLVDGLINDRNDDGRLLFVTAAAAGVMDDELKQAEDKFQESKQLAEIAMQNLLDNDVCPHCHSFHVHSIILPCPTVGVDYPRRYG